MHTAKAPNDPVRSTSRAKILWIPVLLFWVALFVRLINAASAPIAGDELSSLAEAQNNGINLQGLPYFALLHLWTALGTSVLWVRLPSILLGALTVPICWGWLRAMRGLFIANVAALLLLLSPLAVEYAQEVRYYALYLLASILFFVAYWKATHPTSSLRAYGALLVCGVLLGVSHLLGIIVVGLVVLYALVTNRRSVPRWVWITLALAVIALASGLLVGLLRPELATGAYRLFSRLIASGDLTYSGPRGWSPIILAKLALLYDFFGLGQYVYPLTLALVVPGLLILAVFLLLGTLALFRRPSRRFLWFVLFVAMGGIGLVYFVFEALLPIAFRDSASPKFVLFALPMFLWVIAEGAKALRRAAPQIAGAAVLLIVQGVGLAYLYRADWHVTYKAQDFATPTHMLVIENSQDPLLVLADGRAQETLSYYLHGAFTIKDAWNTAPETLETQSPPSAPIAFVSYDDRADVRCHLDPLLAHLALRHETYAWVNYPFIVYTYSAVPDGSLPPDGRLPVPRSVYAPDFADLRLPQAATWDGQPYEISGVYGIQEACPQTTTLHTGPLQGIVSHSLVIFSNLTGASKIPDGTPIAKVVVTDTNGLKTEFTLRKGYETQSWDGACVSGCQLALSWHKRAALVGASTYLGAYNDFQAKIWGVQLSLPQAVSLQSIDVTALSTDYAVNIWEIYSRPG